MANPKPTQTAQFKEKRFQAYGAVDDIPLAKKVTGVKLPIDVHEALAKLSPEERVTYLRRVITEAVRRDLC